MLGIPCLRILELDQVDHTIFPIIAGFHKLETLLFSVRVTRSFAQSGKALARLFMSLEKLRTLRFGFVNLLMSSPSPEQTFENDDALVSKPEKDTVWTFPSLTSLTIVGDYFGDNKIPMMVAPNVSTVSIRAPMSPAQIAQFFIDKPLVKLECENLVPSHGGSKDSFLKSLNQKVLSFFLFFFFFNIYQIHQPQNVYVFCFFLFLFFVVVVSLAKPGKGFIH